MRDRILAAAREAGRDPDGIAFVYNIVVRVDERGDGRPFVVSGTADSVAGQLLLFHDLGFTAINFIPSGPDIRDQIERLASEVIPSVRAHV
jgi:alkanesulfonate monooxygenase SsuD/methylene tetrahydromethanopterin reductase-like flavin-dependent oxidoreductase (luciferase family)